jgi:DNA repair exonuclease SbcCD ATPase subunit
MLDAFKNRTANAKRELLIVDERHELERLIQTARAERTAMDDTLLSLRARSATLKPIGTFLEHIDTKVTAVSTTLEQIGERLTALDGRTRELERLDEHIQNLRDTARQAEHSVQEAISPDGELEKHREAVEQLSAQAKKTQASLSTLKTEHAALEELQGKLRTTQSEIKQSVEYAGTLESELERIRGMAAGLTEDHARLEKTSRTAHEDTAAAMMAIKEVEKKLGPLAQLQELGQSTEDRLVTLNALAERVSLKAKVIEGQQPAVEHALVQANRVNEMVWSMEVQIGKLNEGMKQAATAEGTIARLEKLSADTTERLAAAAKLYEETERQTASLERRGAVLLEAMHTQVATLAVDQKEVETIGERLRALVAAIGRAEARISVFAGQEKMLSTVGQGVEGLSKRFDELFAQSDELTKRQLTLEGLYDRIAHVDDLAKKASSQIDWLRQGRQKLDALQKDVLEFHRSHAAITQLSAGLASDRQAIQALGERMTAISTQAPKLEAKVDAVLDKMSRVENAAQQATVLNEFMSALDGQVSRLETRASLVEKVESRLNGLNTLSTEIDRRLQQQLERHTDFELLQNASEGIVAQISNAHHKLEALDAFHARFLPLIEQVRALQTDIDSTRTQLEQIKPDEAAVTEQARRFAELLAASRVLGTELTDRQHDMQALSEEVTRLENLRMLLENQLEQVRDRQSETVDHIAACEAQLARAERMFNQLEERRVQITIAEKKLVTIEARLSDIRQVSSDLDRSHEIIESREQLVSAVKAELETVHQISARSKSDLDFVMQQRGEVAALRTQIDQLSSRITETDERLASIDARRKLLEEVESKAGVILDLLDDVRINVETIGGQKAVVDQVAQTAAQLEFKLQEARSILGTLQHEREQAERFEQGIRQLYLKTARPEELRIAELHPTP